MQTINFNFDSSKVVKTVKVLNEDVEIGYLNIQYCPFTEEIIVFLGDDKEGDE